ncbi:hypothetical protein CC85DRAFT_288268 [Cutaneotrichosporon oleaginosum]|uniref:Sister chromatid cohesion protein n=1 Tax=Cutaneotrichosporon oleaginosum TaxID=879819 RepID=A0A0J0XF66_9TREE|nr:uncharacterized protein CC85DRAFT_288268 [Cutaneotrichosporon oleaginosum]KLT39698.1 hypothetical protein CC85DRAFT_288268 [Cutaneotrichosporon oleaginosum]TXT12414.1 hypothetical protein COLE_02824 [Cutaneotrichosporon oleaginosum]
MSQPPPRRHNDGNPFPGWANGSQIAPNPTLNDPPLPRYDDPASLLSMVPFAHYTPTARVTEHFSPHTVSYTPPTSAVSVYPQHAHAFQTLEQPQTAQDWQLRQAAEARILAALQTGASYGNMPYAASQSMNGASFQPQLTSSSPLPYAFLPQTPRSNRTATLPPTPSSAAPSSVPSPAPSAGEYFEQMLDHQLRLATPTPSSRASVAAPTPSRRAAQSPDPLNIRSEGPSPTKKARKSAHPSPTRQPSFEIHPPRLTEAQKGMYTSIAPSSISGPAHSTTSMRSTPATRNDDSEEEDIDWGQPKAEIDVDWQMGQEHAAKFEASSHRTVARTGDKDQRSLFQKVQSLLEDIFEESDGFSAAPSLEQVNSSHYFYGLSANGEHPLLSSECVDKLVKNFARLRKSNRSRQTRAETLSLDADLLGRLLRILERSMQDGQDLDPFPDNGRRTVIENASPVKGAKGRKGKKATSNGPEPSPELEVSEEEKNTGERTLATLSNAAAAALCCLVVLRTPGVPKELYSEDLLTKAITTVRSQMAGVLFPVIEGLAGDKIRSNYLAWIVTDEASAAAKGKSKKDTASFNNPFLSSIAHFTSAAVPHITGLINKHNVTFGEQLIINAVYLALGPVFVHEPARRGKAKAPGTATWALMKTLRTDALGCLRVIFAKYENQRQWILQEIIDGLGKSIDSGSTNTRYQLADGTSINILSALFLQLVQAFSFGVGPAIRKLRSRNIDIETGEPQNAEAVAEEESRMCLGVVEKVGGYMKFVVSVLVRKAIATKTSRGEKETDYSVVLSALVSDLITVIYRPEWPTAALFLSVLLKTLLEEPGKIKGAFEANAARGLALDYLGDIAAKIHSLEMEMNRKTVIPSFNDVLQDVNVDGLAKLFAAHQTVQSYLTAASREDGMLVTAGEMTRILWANDISKASQRATSLLERFAAEPDEAASAEKVKSIIESLHVAAHDVWSGEAGNVFDPGSNQLEEAIETSLALSRCNPLQEAFKQLLYELTKYMDSSVVSHRSKALRGLTQVVVADPEILADANVRVAIEDRLNDASTSVRDVAVDLIGKYVVQRSELAVQYFPLLAARVTDTGLLVRKRVVKMLRDMFSTTDDSKLGIDICCKLVVATQDEDDGIKDLGIKSLTDILYPSTGFVAADTAALLVEILHRFDGPTLSLENAIQGVHSACKKNGHSNYFGETIDALINRMVDATEDTEFDAGSHIRAIFLLSQDDPALIDTNKASVLLSYLRPPSNMEEQNTLDQILQIFVRSIPFLPKAASAFANELTTALRGMVQKPAGAPHTLRWTVACYCVVTKHLTKAYLAVSSLLRGCHDKLKAVKLDERNPQVMRQVSTMYYITALIVENIDFDAIARDDDQIARSIKAMMPRARPLAEHFFDIYLDFSSKVTNQQIPILCLSAVFRSNPQLILDTKAGDWMAKSFKSGSPDTKSKLLELIHDFLVSESKRRIVKGPVTKDIKDLIGANNEIHDSVVSTSLVQRTIDYVKEAAMSHTPSLQRQALNVLEFTVNQGLYHPVMLMPVLIPLEASEDQALADSALVLHSTLHLKHSTLLNVQHLDFVRASYDYLRGVSSEVSGERRGAAALGGWYGLLSDKRAWRLEFLRALTKAFDFDVEASEPIDPQFVLYVAENLCMLDYQQQEEPMLVVQALSHVVRDGASTANHIELAQVAAADSDSIAGKMAIISEKQQFPALHLANASLVVGIALLTKNLLLEVYGLTEDKCLRLERGKKTAYAEKAVARKEQYQKNLIPLDTSQYLPLAREGIETVGHYRLQQATILQLMRDDGALGWNDPSAMAL